VDRTSPLSREGPASARGRRRGRPIRRCNHPGQEEKAGIPNPQPKIDSQPIPAPGGASVSGLIDGGSGGDNWLDYAAYAAPTVGAPVLVGRDVYFSGSER
jgi:hypothetical protein